MNKAYTPDSVAPLAKNMHSKAVKHYQLMDRMGLMGSMQVMNAEKAQRFLRMIGMGSIAQERGMVRVWRYKSIQFIWKYMRVW